jgi:hypothetical protein
LTARQRGSGEAGQCFLLGDYLPVRLMGLGLRDVDRIVTHANRTVMLSLNRRVLRIHQGYAFAPDEILTAIVRFLDPRIPRSRRRAAEREFLDFPVVAYGAALDGPPVRERAWPGDAALLSRLQLLHQQLNADHFGGALRDIPIRISSRMKTRLGEVTIDPSTEAVSQITISRRHLRRHGWSEVTHTMLHEMVHQWQAEAGLPVDHGPAFRDKAGAVGVHPRAKRTLPSRNEPLSRCG